ncbi:hypothetical protein Bpfe_003260 [Biomphalaria pfeifferi]|uniref:Uncharacterized protein n=1 Tax=Biomphalaria pfeifferi TaxID=112525 RepID=A0AAD8C727_BIOPF|nr:hypothetical protein Bpfe_003260 [Biomphalaria pfeifferi]
MEYFTEINPIPMNNIKYTTSKRFLFYRHNTSVFYNTHGVDYILAMWSALKKRDFLPTMQQWPLDSPVEHPTLPKQVYPVLHNQYMSLAVKTVM